MPTLKTYIAYLVLIASIIQTSVAVEHQFSDSHINDCMHSLCINPLLLDDISEPSFPDSFQFASLLESLPFNVTASFIQLKRRYTTLSRAPPNN